ncbi:MAG: serine/threonine-protein kinase [Planctomycetota bacterium]
MSRCPDDAVLESLAEGSPVAPDLRAHLNECPDCARRVRSLRADSRLFAELRAVASGPAADGAPPRARLERYRLVRELHRGSQGTVFEGIDTETRDRVAVKLLAVHPLASRRDQSRFEREIELLSRLRHPGIVPIVDQSDGDERPFYVMPWIDGTHLDRFVGDLDLSPDERLDVGLAIVDAVAYAHRSGVIHRDLKPSNILVTADRQPVLIDFGLAKPQDVRGSWSVTESGEFLGTLGYASPEQLRGGKVGTPADVYALGVVLCELLTGQHPHGAARSISELIESTDRDRPPKLPRRGSLLEPGLLDILEKALDPDPEHRYASASELAKELRAHRSGERRSRRESGQRLRRFARRHRWSLGISGLLAMVVAIAGIVSINEHLQAESQRRTAVAVRQILEEILAAARPDRMGGSVQIVDVLDQVARRMESSLVHAPDAQAAARLAIGETYFRLMMSEEAERHLERALQRYRVAKSDPAGLATCLTMLGRLRTGDRRETAKGLLEEAIAIRRRTLPRGHPQIAVSERELGWAIANRFESPDITEGRRRIQGALRALEGTGGPSLEIAETLVLLGRLAMQVEDVSEARDLFERAFALAESAGGRDDLASIHALEGLAWVDQHLGHFAAAEAWLLRLVESMKRLVGDKAVPSGLRRLASLQAEQGQLVTAEDLHRRAVAQELAWWQGERPAVHERLEELRRGLIGDEHGAGRLEDAPFREAFIDLRELRGRGDFELSHWLNLLAELRREQRRPELARELLTEALEIYCRLYGEECPNRTKSLLQLAELDMDQLRWTDALERLDTVLEVADRRGLERSAVAQEALARKQQCLAAMEGVGR